MASNRAAPADGRAWQGSRGRPARDQRHPPCSQERLPVVRLPAGIRPPTTIYNRFVRWAERGVWERLFRELAKRGRSAEVQMIDSTHIKAHRSASGAKRGSAARLLAARAAGEIPKSTPSRC